MDKFKFVEKIGLRNKDTKELIAVYPFKPEGTDAEIKKLVTDWYYQSKASAEEELRNAYVDFLTDHEVDLHR